MLDPIRLRLRRVLIVGYLLPLVPFLFLCLNVHAEEDYKFIDSGGKEILFPKSTPIFSRSNPGPWKGSEQLIEPQLDTRIRRQGLEMIRILEIRIPYPAGSAGDNRLQALYVLDKDGLIIGYQKFDPEEEYFFADIWINGIINYIQIYIESSRNGLWRKEFHFEFKK